MRLRGPALAAIAVALLACLSCGGTVGDRGATAADRDASTDGRAGDDASSPDGGIASGSSDAGDGGHAPVTCSWTPGDHAAQCPTTPCPIVEDVNVTCTDEDLGSPGLRVAPAPAATWLVTSSQNERYAFSIVNGQGTSREGLPADFADQTIALALSSDGQPVLATDTLDFVTTQGDAGPPITTGVGGTQLETLAADGWHGSTIEGPPGAAPAMGLEVAIDGTPNVWVGNPPPYGYKRGTLGAAGWALTDAPVPANGNGQNLFTLARDGAPISFDMVFDGIAEQPPLRVHALVDGVDFPLNTVSGGGGYTIADPPSPMQPLVGPRAMVALLESDGIHVAGLGTPGWTETVVPSTVPLEEVCGRSNTTGCPPACHETAAGVSTAENGRSEAVTIGLAWTNDGLAWLAYVVVRVDEQVHFASLGVDPGGCQEIVDSGGASYEVHLTRVSLDGSTTREVFAMPVPPIGGQPTGYTRNQAQARTARWFDLRAFGTDLALGFLTVDANGVSTVRVLRIDTTAVTEATP